MTVNVNLCKNYFQLSLFTQYSHKNKTTSTIKVNTRLKHTNLRVRVRHNSGDISQRLSKVIRGKLKKMDENLLNSRDLKNVAMSMYRERRKRFLKLPKSKLEVHEALEGLNLQTNKNENFTLVNDAESGIVIFSCNTNLKCLCNAMCDIVSSPVYLVSWSKCRVQEQVFRCK